ncbi:WD40/YVTN/BNR-like repeat-containing protein [Dictyobacter halimunensis]|uniref:WD40/YVTN/BNR-like repeat-containing protein n=1 Tax=Dictyobacter halimunensis TaxID=3026934 RepID=UPI0030C6A62D
MIKYSIAKLKRGLTTLPLFLSMALVLLLSACSNAGSSASTPSAGTTPTATAQANATPTSSSTTTADSSSTGSNSGSSSKPTVPLTAIRMLDAQNGWSLTASSILRTSDGGAHWKDVTPANAGLNKDAKATFMNGQYAWIAIPPANMQEGAGITILRTSTGGTSWQSSKINDPRVSIIDMPHFLNAQEGWLEASSTPGAGHAGSDIWHSTDGGQTWTQLSSNADSSGLRLGYVTGISLKNSQTGIATGNLGAGGDNSVPSIALTQNGGKNWQMLSLPHLLGGYTEINTNSQPPVFFGNTVIMPVSVSAQDNPDLLVLYRSNDGGQHWTQTSVVHIAATNTYVLDANHAWATDTKTGKLYSTTDGGDHWNVASNAAYNLQALSFTNASTGWGVSSQSLYHTTDGGQTWQQIQYTIQ